MSLAPIDSRTKIERAIRLTAFRAVRASRSSASVRVDGALATGRRLGRRAFPRARRAEQPVRNGGAQCMPAADRSPRCADIARRAPVRCGSDSCTAERWRGGVEPERALALPHLQQIGSLAGASAFVAGAARTIILGAALSRDRSGSRNHRPIMRSAGPDCLHPIRCCRRGRR